MIAHICRLERLARHEPAPRTCVCFPGPCRLGLSPPASLEDGARGQGEEDEAGAVLEIGSAAELLAHYVRAARRRRDLAVEALDLQYTREVCAAAEHYVARRDRTPGRPGPEEAPPGPGAPGPGAPGPGAPGPGA